MVALWVAALYAAPPVRAQQAAPEAPVQILTADLARTQTVNADRIGVTFLVVGERPIREVRINGRPQATASDTVVVVHADIELPQTENLIEVVAIDVAGRRREKSYLVIREQVTPPVSTGDRHAAITGLIDQARFDQARTELALWRSEGGPPQRIDALQRVLIARLSVVYGHLVLERLNERRYDDAQRQLEALEAAGGDPATVAALRQKLSEGKRTVLAQRVERHILAGAFDDATALLNDWDTAGDSPQEVARLRDVLRDWRESPPRFADVVGIPETSGVQLTVRGLSAGVEMPEGQRLAEIRTLGHGPGRYGLPGPGEYTLDFVNEGVHERAAVEFGTERLKAVVVIEPALRYEVQGRWDSLADLPAPIAAPGVIVRKGKIQVVGGYRLLAFERGGQRGSFTFVVDKSEYDLSGNVSFFDPARDQWTIAPLPAGAVPKLDFLFEVFALPTETVLITSRSQMVRFPPDWSANTVTEYPLPRLYGRPTVVRFLDRLYVFGGVEVGEADPATGQARLNERRDSSRFGLAQDFWVTTGRMPGPRGGGATAVVGSSIYLIGGLSGGKAVGDVLRFDTRRDEWRDSNVPPMPTARAWASAAVVNGEIYVIGGEGVQGRGSDALDVVEIFNPATGTWRSGPAMPTPRRDAGVAVVAGDIYVIGGYSGNKPVDAVEVLR